MALWKLPHACLLVAFTTGVLGLNQRRGVDSGSNFSETIGSTSRNHLQSLLYLSTHHKTGTELAGGSRKCFSNTKFNRAYSGNAAVFSASNVYMVHFVRNAFSMLVSEYLYHRDVGEPWSTEKGSAAQLVTSLIKLVGTEESFVEKLDIKGESYTAFLNRVHLKVGLLAEMQRMQSEVTAIEKADETCRKHKACMKVCLERFTSSSTSFDFTWKKIIKFAHVHGNHKTIMECLGKMDLHRAVQDSKHVTKGTVSQHMVEEMIHVGELHDKKYFGGRLKKLATGTPGTLDCKSSSSKHLEVTPDDLEASSETGWSWEEEEALA